MPLKHPFFSETMTTLIITRSSQKKEEKNHVQFNFNFGEQYKIVHSSQKNPFVTSDLFFWSIFLVLHTFSKYLIS